MDTPCGQPFDYSDPFFVNSLNVAIGSRSSLDEEYYTWQLTFYFDTMTILNTDTYEYLYAPSGSTILTSTMKPNEAHWRFCKMSEYVNMRRLSVPFLVRFFFCE